MIYLGDILAEVVEAGKSWVMACVLEYFFNLTSESGERANVLRIRKLIAFHDSDEEIRRKSYHC